MNLFDSGRVEFEKWVIHEIPKVFKRSDEELNLKLSEALSPFDNDVARFFERKLSESFGRSRHAITPGDGEPVYSITKQFDTGSADLLTLSTELAKRLASAQSGAMSGGLLVIAQGTHGADTILAVLKLEKEEGARAATVEVDGKATYSVEYMRDLFLTGKTRIFKVAVFALSDEVGLTGWVSDPQSRGAEVADFFISGFLNFRLALDPQTATRQFHDAAEEYINQGIDDAEKKARYETALVAELQNNAAEINVDQFARNNLDVEDRDGFVHSMDEAHVSRTVVKDTTLIQSRLRRVQYEFQQGVKVSKPVDLPDDVVAVDNLNNGKMKLTITDTLKKVGSRG